MPTMENQVALKHSRTQAQCRNKVMPNDLTEMFRSKINALPDDVRTSYLKAEIFSKYISDDTDPAEVRRERAIAKWLATEERNESTNERLLVTPEEFNILPRVAFGDFTAFARDLIAKIIGDTAPVEALIGSFSGGASTSRNRTSSHPATKYLGTAHVTQRCLDVFTDLVDEMPGWLREIHPLSLEVVEGNVMFTVPKKTDIDRCACKEPDINMFVQKGIGSYFRKCLKSAGINLNDQSINRSFARIGSLTGSLATLDLSSASDSVCDVLVSELLPECWYTLLDSVRSHVTIIDGEKHRNEMFSSMGNGFTFELESLLFYALTRTTCFFRGVPGTVSVYGDDIICPSEVVPYLEYVLGYFGFQVNPDKSFSEGPFRESCGGHYHDGRDITPFYVKAPISRLTDVIDVANKLRFWGSDVREGFSYQSVVDPLVEEIWLWLKNFIPSYLWGGEDYTFKFQLVSYDQPTSRLYEETKSLNTGTGGYLHWLNATWDRTELRDGVSTSSKTTNLSRYRVRPVRSSAVPRLQSLFLSELGLTPSMEGREAPTTL